LVRFKRQKESPDSGFSSTDAMKKPGRGRGKRVFTSKRGKSSATSSFPLSKNTEADRSDYLKAIVENAR
jgi:hypothetical protein